ncbi:Hypothetical predicted protein, partial [Olea europaea subsp. europaea]
MVACVVEFVWCGAVAMLQCDVGSGYDDSVGGNFSGGGCAWLAALHVIYEEI